MKKHLVVLCEFMRKNNPKFNEWRKWFSYKKWLRNSKRVNRKRKKKSGKNLESEVASFVLPSNFSLINNYEEVVAKFSSIKRQIISKNFHRKKVYLDMSGIESVSVDALMYLLVFIKNIKAQTVSFELIGGNLPKDEQCSKIVKQSGFLRYLKTNATPEFSKDNVQIFAGDKLDSTKVGEICSFVQTKFGSNMISTKKLYGSFGEIIGNSIEHAYEDEEHWKKWIVYVEYADCKIQVVVLDTGSGIINTMTKKGVFEKMDLLPLHKQLLKSALNGEFRSKTKMSYRNKGLPNIRENALNNILKNLVLFSNDVKYTCCKNEQGINEGFYSLNNSLEGTLYYFEFIPEDSL